MLKQLSAMVATMGDWNSASKSVNPPDMPEFVVESDSSNAEEYKQKMLQMKLDEQTKHRQNVCHAVSKNVTDLSSVLTNPGTAKQFLKHTPSSTINMESTMDTTETNELGSAGKTLDEEQQAGPLATLLVACAYALPLQTSSYAALTRAVETGVHAHDTEEYKGFAKRCLQMASARLHVDLSQMLHFLPGSSASDNDGAQNVVGSSSECFRRCKFLLRYLALLMKAGILQAHVGEEIESHESTKINMGMMDLLQYLAEKQTELSREPEGALLSYLILSTVPYLLDATNIDKAQLQSLVDRVGISVSQYQSPYKPSQGVLAILLKEEPQDIDDEDESDDEYEEEDEPCCDSLQELLRANYSLLENSQDSMFGALSDAPWNNDSTVENEVNSLYLTFIPLPGSVSSDDQKSKSLLPAPHHPLSSIILGRLPIYQAPSAENDDDDDEEEEEKVENKPQGPYVANFTLSARTLLNDSIRDILLCHHPTISSSGLEQGSCKSVAEHIWSLNILFAPHSVHGMEFGIVECFLGLLAQSHQLATTTTKNGTNLTRIYISRVLLELTNLYPTKIPQALAITVATLVEDILPSLVPQSVHVLADWFAFHLVNTDFQWPKEYWTYWSQEDNLKGCKRVFFSRVLGVIASLAGEEAIRTQCLPSDSSILNLLSSTKGNTVYPIQSSIPNTSDDLEKELRDRMWIEMELSETLDDWITEYDDSYEDAKLRDGDFWRAKLVTRALLSPPGLRSENHTDAANSNDEDMEGQEEGRKEKDDPLQDLFAGLRRYAPLVASSITKGFTSLGNEEDEYQKDAAEAAVMKQMQEILESNTSLTFFVMKAIYEAVLQHKIISPLGFLKFAMSNTSFSSINTVYWYHKASLCTKYAVSSIITSITDGVGMIMDSDDKSMRVINVVKQVTESLAPLMEYASKRVCSLLISTLNEMSNSGKKFKVTRDIVVLVEGLKKVLWEGQAHCCKLIKQYFDDGPGKILLGEIKVNNDIKIAVTELLENLIGGKTLISSCKESIEESEGLQEMDSDKDTVNDLLFSWMEKLIVA